MIFNKELIEQKNDYFFLINQSDYQNAELRYLHLLKKKNLVLEGVFFNKLQCCKKLVSFSFNIEQNDISVPYISNLINGIQQLKNLEKIYLNLEKNRIDAQCIKKLVEGFQKCSKLQNIDLNLRYLLLFNYLFNYKMYFFHFQNYKNQHLLYNQSQNRRLDKKALQNLSYGLLKCKNVTHLCLSFQENNIDDDSLYEFSSGISKCLTLQQFDINLRQNKITLAGITCLAQSLLNCVVLQNLSVNLMQNLLYFYKILNLNKVKITSCSDFSYYLGQHQNLRSLKLNFKSQSIGDKFVSFEQLNFKHLTTLNLKLRHKSKKKLEYLETASNFNVPKFFLASQQDARNSKAYAQIQSIFDLYQNFYSVAQQIIEQNRIIKLNILNNQSEYFEEDNEEKEGILTKLKLCTNLQNLSLVLNCNKVQFDSNEISNFKNLQSLNLHLKNNNFQTKNMNFQQFLLNLKQQQEKYKPDIQLVKFTQSQAQNEYQEQAQEDSFNINFQLQKGKKFAIEIGEKDSLSKVQFEIQKEKDIPIEEQILLFRDQILNYDQIFLKQLGYLTYSSTVFVLLKSQIGIKIQIKEQNKQTFHLVAELTSKIEYIKQQIDKLTGLQSNQYHLQWDNQFLLNSMMIFSICGSQQENITFQIIKKDPQEKQIKINLVMPQGNKIELQAYLSDLVYEIKEKIFLQKNIPILIQQLRINNKILLECNTFTLSQYKIQQDSNIFVSADRDIGNMSCFVQNTLVTLANGEKKKIRDISVGDQVMSYNTEDEILQVDIVQEVMQFKANIFCNIQFENSSIICTLNHPFYNPEEKTWKCVYTEGNSTLENYLSVNDSLLLDDKSHSYIKHIKFFTTEGDLVKSYNIVSEAFDENIVTSIIKHEADQLCKINFGDQYVVCTVNHRFYDPESKQWKSVCPNPGSNFSFLKKNDHLFSEKGEKLQITEIKTFTTEQPVFIYHIQVENNHNFFANGVLAHNMQINIQLQNGEKFKLDVQPEDKIVDIKQMIFQKTKIQVKDQILNFTGNELVDDSTLSDYSITESTEEQTLHVQIKLDFMTSLLCDDRYAPTQQMFYQKKDKKQYAQFRIITPDCNYFFTSKKDKKFQQLEEKIKPFIEEEFLMIYGGKIIRDKLTSFQDFGINESFEMIVISSSNGGEQINLFDQIQSLKPNQYDWTDVVSKFYNKNEVQQTFQFARDYIQKLKVNDYVKKIAIPITIWTSNLLYRQINQALSNNKFSDWIPYLREFINSIKHLPYYEGKAYRGIKDFTYQNFDYKVGNYVTWKNVISFSKSEKQARKFSSQEGALFEVKVISAKQIFPVSIFEEEQEVLLLPFSCFLVESIHKQKGSPMIIKMKEICVPRSIQVVIWVDDNPNNNYKYAYKIEKQNPNVSIVFCKSTFEAERILNQFKWIAHLEKFAIRVISDMVRVEEDGKTNQYAGIQLVELFFKQLKYNTEIMIFCNNVEQANKILLEKNFLNARIAVTNQEDKVIKFALFQQI
ncbi:hypothetical protein ABPG72_022622 [Tetrahymena utriculariae]